MFTPQINIPQNELQFPPNQQLTYLNMPPSHYFPKGIVKVDSREDGKRHDMGTLIYSDGSVYEGTIVDGKEHGTGTLKNKDGLLIYKGNWKAGNKHGTGTYIDPNRKVYEGTWVDGKTHGTGTL